MSRDKTFHTFVRTIKCMAVAGGKASEAIAFARGQNWTDADAIEKSIKMASVAPFTTSDSGFVPTPAGFDFAEYIRPLTIIGRLAGLRRVPSRVRMLAATSGTTAYWKGEAQVRPISQMELSGETMEMLNVVAIAAVTLELLRSSDPSAEGVISRDIAAAAVQAMDEAFIGYQNAGEAGVRPASVTYGVTPIHSTGSSLSQIDNDLGLLIQALTDAGSDLQFAAFVMRPRTALYLARLRGTGGALAHPGMTAKGGTLLGLPAITSAAVPMDAGSPSIANTAITLVDAAQVTVADDGGSRIELARHAALQMSDAPGAGAQTLVSLWQCDCAALRIVRYANWKRCRDGMAQVLDNVSY